MRRHLSLSVLLMLVVASAGGCRTPSLDCGGQVRKGAPQLDSLDVAICCEYMVESLMESGILDNAPQHPAVITIGRILNNTSQYFDSDLLTTKIRVALYKSGKATCIVIATTNANWVLSGKITESVAKSGRSVPRSYSVILSLADMHANVILWEDEKTTGKGACGSGRLRGF